MTNFQVGDIVTQRGIDVDGPDYEVTAVYGDGTMAAENLNNGLEGYLLAGDMRLAD